MDDKRVPGRAKGGHARAEALSADERTQIARRAAVMRWETPPLKATHSGDLKIGDLVIPCAVLEDGRRVISWRGIGSALGKSFGGQSWKRFDPVSGADDLPFFLASKNLEPYIEADLRVLVSNPIRYVPLHRGRPAYGLEATVLPGICDVWLRASVNGALADNQKHVAEKADILLRGFATVGIIALIDEATGFQDDRAKFALARILEEFIAKELQPWVKTFPSDYYRELFRLRGLEFPKDSVQRPQYFGVLTNDIVYKRLAPGVLKVLREQIPRHVSGRLKHKLFQKLTEDRGYPKLREHLGAVVAIMKLSNDYLDFIGKLDRHYPRYADTIPLPFLEYESGADDGRGL